MWGLLGSLCFMGMGFWNWTGHQKAFMAGGQVGAVCMSAKGGEERIEIESLLLSCSHYLVSVLVLWP